MIKESYIDHNGKTVHLEYHDVDSFDDLDRSKCAQVYGVCFHGNRMVVGFGGQKKDWGLIGGTIEDGESSVSYTHLRAHD